MCDYSLHAVASRAAQVAETIVSAQFSITTTRGFASPSDPNTAVCLLPGTELEFEADARVRGILFSRSVRARLARFRQLFLDKPYQHHDALEFSNGKIVMVTDLVCGQRVTVLQLPVSPSTKPANSGMTKSAVELQVV